ncbi:MAG: tRNA 2-selenouridine(34) synthase MnmH [Dethiobacter sp.]|jgi:tRNA 2-selenouridine synthase|nr:MAG: tRNA 2-selenouridine(34) synthase MnmH [Dethiobacter sp.]
MSGKIPVKEALELPGAVFIDVRSPYEYRQGSIPGSLNIPLFNDEEREIIGIAYKENEQQARFKGLSFATPKLPDIIKKIKKLSHNKTPVLYCWRGGMRSQSIYTVLEMLDIPAYRLEGGYKSFRRFILAQFSSYELKKPVFVLNGLTGTGKTEVLHILAEMGCPCLDLEGLACHRGSLFGHLGFKEVRYQKDFDALLWNRLEELKNAGYLIVEGEGKRIGSVYVPDFLFRAMQEDNHILLTAPLEKRVERLLKEYTPSTDSEKEKVREAIFSLRKYLGTKTVEHFFSLLREEKYGELVGQLCQLYYDRLYSESKPEKTNFVLTVDSSDTRKAAEQVKEFVHKTVKERVYGRT